MIETAVVRADDFVIGIDTIDVSDTSGKRARRNKAYSSVFIRPWMLSANSVSWFTGLREDSETSNMMDQ